MRKKHTTKAKGGGNQLTPEEAGFVGTCLAHTLAGSQPDLSLLLLLVHAFTFEADESAREQMRNHVEQAVGPYLRGFDRLTAEGRDRGLAIVRRQAAADLVDGDEI